jgi:endonuclease YncB( thermonuclease family)
MKPGWTYRVLSCEVLDGDTVRCVVDLGFSVTMTASMRLCGIDTPEKRPLVSRAAALRSEEFLRALITAALNKNALVARTEKNDAQEKYGRYLVWLWEEGASSSMNLQLIQAGLAKSYYGGKKE